MMLTRVAMMGIRQGLAVLVLWALALPGFAQALNYDAFSDRDGNVTTERHGLGLIALLQGSGQLEAVYADALKGNARAQRVFQELEDSYFPDTGRELAELVSRPPCLLPALRELSGWCVPDWTFLSFLSRDKPGGARLREALFDGYAERARQRRLENQLILSAMNALLGAVVIATVGSEAGIGPLATKTSGAVEVTRVGRWMSEGEYQSMRASGRVQAPLNGAGATHVTVPPDPSSFKPPPQSARFVEFDVPTAQLRVHDVGKGWGRVFGPGSLEARAAEAKGLPVPTAMPPATNIRVVTP